MIGSLVPAPVAGSVESAAARAADWTSIGVLDARIFAADWEAAAWIAAGAAAIGTGGDAGADGSHRVNWSDVRRTANPCGVRIEISPIVTAADPAVRVLGSTSITKAVTSGLRIS